MKTEICDQYGIEFPLFAFSHCRDVVAAVTNAGGFGVLGGVAFRPDQLEQELTWIDEHVNGKPYGVDIIVPAKYEGKGENLTRDQLAGRIPAEFRDFINELLEAHDIEAEELRVGSSALGGDTGKGLLDVALNHPIKMMANALGVPPDYMIEAGKERGIPVAALVGAKEHAIKQVQAGVDLIVVQGTEAGGHCGEVTTLVLIPEVLDAIAKIPGGKDVPVLAAGGIVTGRQMAACVAMGAAGTDVAMETADIVLMGDRLENIALLVGHARRAKRVLLQNLVFASGVIVVLISAALGFSLALPLGVVGHEGSTVLVCLNGLRLLLIGRATIR